MQISNPEQFKQEVRNYWNQQSCDTQVAVAEKFSKEYFEQIENYRYFDQYFIHSFAQFSRYHGKRVLEVGFGAGTDFIQWLRSGAIASGIDLTQEALQNLTNRIKVYNLPQPEKIQVADAENLPFPDNYFDLGYSFGVLHMTADTPKAVRELIRVIRPGGEFKIMIYNRHSVYVFNQWLKHCALKGKPWKSLAYAMWNHIESRGCKGYTRSELVRWFSELPLEDVHIHTDLTSADYLSAIKFPPLNLFYRALIRLVGYQYAWHVPDYVDRGKTKTAAQIAQRRAPGPYFSGNRLGFFVNISGRKKA
jgi:ubiquinone/menaquinone biosynthesis C-methylase UbiE